MQPIMYECARCEGEYFGTADLIRSHVREKHGVSAVNRKINKKCCKVPGINLQEQEGDCHLHKDTALDGAPGLCMESNLTDTANLLDISMSKDLITIHYSDLTIEEVSGFSKQSDDETSDSVEIPEVCPSPADDAISCCSDSSPTHDVAEPTHNIEVTSLDSTETTSINNEALSSGDDLVREGEDGPYRCTDCGRSLGYSLGNMKYHVVIYKGLCKQLFTGKTFYTCQTCQIDFNHFLYLKRHNKKLGKSCKDRQISSNGKSLQKVTEDIPQRIQSMDTTESVAERNYSVSSAVDLITDEDSEPYYCPDCRRCLGYSITIYKRHITKYRGTCRERFAGETFYACKHCQLEFMNLHSLKTHRDKNGDFCKSNHISMNRDIIIHNSESDIPQRIQSMDTTESVAERNYSVSSAVDLITDEDSEPYYCPDCRRCLGYSITNYKRHITRYRGSCREKFAGKKLYVCKYCQLECIAFRNLSSHHARNGDLCKSKQISLNLNAIIHNSDGEVRETLKHGAISPAGATLTNKELISSLCNKLKSTQKRGPYACSICGKGMGYSFVNLKRHLTRYKGHCIKALSCKKFYPCRYCGSDFSTVYKLTRHNRMFGERCKP